MFKFKTGLEIEAAPAMGSAKKGLGILAQYFAFAFLGNSCRPDERLGVGMAQPRPVGCKQQPVFPMPANDFKRVWIIEGTSD